MKSVLHVLEQVNQEILWYLPTSSTMIQNKFGEMIFSESDVCDLVMQGRDLDSLRGMLVDPSVNIEQVIHYVENYNATLSYPVLQADNVSVPAFDLAQQKNWHMPVEYNDMDIAEYVLGLCRADHELQRVPMLHVEHSQHQNVRWLTVQPR
jgi:hypothetical protein